jgi:hypothetical protein
MYILNVFGVLDNLVVIDTVLALAHKRLAAKLKQDAFIFHKKSGLTEKKETLAKKEIRAAGKRLVIRKKDSAKVPKY